MPVVIHYSAGRSGAMRLEIFEATGRLVRTLEQGVVAVGDHTRYWDRRSDTGTNVARGLHLVRLSVGGSMATEKLALLHR